MKTIQPFVTSARLCGLSAGLALSIALNGCAHSVTSHVVPESQVITAAELPAGSTAPRAVRKVAPVVPEDLKRAGQEGEVELMCQIDERGDVRHIAVTQASNPRFVAAASKALQQWKFTPGTRDGQAVAMSIVVPMRFVFDDPAANRPTGAYVAATP